jgi:hypothetical protein
LLHHSDDERNATGSVSAAGGSLRVKPRARGVFEGPADLASPGRAPDGVGIWRVIVVDTAVIVAYINSADDAHELVAR